MGNKPVRIQRKRVKGWRMPPNTKSVTRPGKWGNPTATADNYRLWVTGKLELFDLATNAPLAPPTVEAIRRELRGFNLACFCKDGAACHADVLLELANAPEAEPALN